MTLRSLHHLQISIPVGAEDEARNFYCGVLGLTEIPKPAELAGRGGFWLELGGQQIHFGTEDNIDRARSKAHAAYLVDGLDEWRSKLIQAGCEIIEGIQIPHFRRFEFRDPFDNRVEFMELLAVG